MVLSEFPRKELRVDEGQHSSEPMRVLISIDNLRSQLYSSVFYYTRISRHVSANSKPSSGAVAYRILKVSNHIKIVTDPLNLCNLSTDVVFATLQTNQGVHIRYYAYEWKQYKFT
jgi:hypothetical protein